MTGSRPNTVALRLSDEVVEWADAQAADAGQKRSLWLANFLALAAADHTPDPVAEERSEAEVAPEVLESVVVALAAELVTHMNSDDLFEPVATPEPVAPPCSHPRSKWKVLAYATVCECGVKVR